MLLQCKNYDLKELSDVTRLVYDDLVGLNYPDIVRTV